MRIGKYSYPKFRLELLLSDIKKMYEYFGSRGIKREEIANLLDHAPRSGTLSQKLADMKSYGLLSGKRGVFSITEIGKQATHGEDDQKIESTEKAFKNIQLWNIFFDKYGVDIKENDFLNFLSQITGEEMIESKISANEIIKAYMDDVKCLNNVKKSLKSKSFNDFSEVKEMDEKSISVKDMGEIEDMKDKHMQTSNKISEAYVIDMKEWGEAKIVVNNIAFLDILRVYIDTIEKKMKEGIDKSVESEDEKN